MRRIGQCLSAVSALVFLNGCGIYVPTKDPLHANDRNEDGLSREGRSAANIVSKIRCEIQKGIYEASKFPYVSYLGKNWGSQVTLKLTWDELSGLTPNFSMINPLPTMQSFSLSIGASATAHATRLETITFFLENHQLLADARTNALKNYPLDCSRLNDGVMIDGDLLIDQFIYDEASLAQANVATTNDPSKPQFSTFQEDITFVGSFGGNITPVWKLTRLSANSTGTLANATRTVTGDILITLGPQAVDSKGNLLPRLADPAASQHTAGITGGSTANQINALSH